MKKIIIYLLLLFISCGEKSCFDIIQCNSLRQIKNKTADTKIAEITERIKKLEADKVNENKNRLLLGDLYSNLGSKYLDSAQWDSSIEAFNNALKKGRTNHIIYYSMGLAYGNKGKISKNKNDIDKAQALYEKSLELEPGYHSAGYALAILLFFEKNEKKKAVNILEKITVRYKSFFESRFALGRFYFELDELTKSLNTYESLCSDLEKASDSEIIIEFRAQCKENLQRIKSQL